MASPLPLPVTFSAVKSYVSLRRPRYIAAGVLIATIFWLSLHVYHAPHRHSTPFTQIPTPLVHWPPLPPISDANSTNRWRAERIRNAFIHSYDGYLEHAFPEDELRPLSARNATTLNGWGVTMYDALDTMWMMRLPQYLDHAIAHLTAAPPQLYYQKPTQYAPFFETVIRYLGGLLGAYALTGHDIFLHRADELGTLLLPAMNTASGLPMYSISTFTGTTRGGWMAGALWAEALSCQLEFKYLAHLTDNVDYFDKVENIMRLMESANNQAHPDEDTPEKKEPRDHMTGKGVFPTYWDVKTGKPKNRHFSAGSFADSAHEYLLKQYLMTAKSEPRALALYLDAVDAILNKLTYHSSLRDFIYVTDIDGALGRPSHTFEHLTCFLPGMLKLGAHSLDLPEEKKQLHTWAAQGLSKTCWLMYADMPTSIGPDEIVVDSVYSRPWLEVLAEGIYTGLSEAIPERDRAKRGYRVKSARYLLRPEALESWYIMWKLGEGEIWRERAWTVFEAIEATSRTKYAYACITNVDVSPAAVTLKDELPSYFFAETLKYLYLMFDETVDLPFERWVFNTEAHPLPIFEWTDAEKRQYHIPS